MNESMKKYIAKKMDKSLSVIDKYERIILKYMGEYDPSKTYCGPGKTGDRLVPDLMFGYAGWSHDGLVSGIEHKEGVDKYHADLFFYYTMLYIAGWNPIKRCLAYIYYKSVDKFGDY